MYIRFYGKVAKPPQNEANQKSPIDGIIKHLSASKMSLQLIYSTPYIHEHFFKNIQLDQFHHSQDSDPIGSQTVFQGYRDLLPLRFSLPKSRIV